MFVGDLLLRVISGMLHDFAVDLRLLLDATWRSNAHLACTLDVHESPLPRNEILTFRRCRRPLVL
jgi:hypothetical protein